MIRNKPFFVFRPQSLVLSLLTSLLLYLSSPGPGYGFVAWIAVFPLLVICKIEKVRSAVFWGFIAGFIYYLGLLYWIVIVLGRYGGLSLWLTVPALILLAGYMAVYTAFFAWLMSRTMTCIPPVWSAPLIWVGLDFLRNRLFSGFPWQDIGYSQYLYPRVIQVADIAGHQGISFLIIMVNAFLFTIIFYEKDHKTGLFKTRRKTYKRHHLLPAFGILSAAVIYNIISYQHYIAPGRSPVAGIALVQGNIKQDQKWLPENRRHALKTYLKLSKKILANKSVDLLVWPETALPFSPRHDPLYSELLLDLYIDNGTNLLTGAPVYQIDDKKITIYNSALLITESGIRDRYDKQHLVPFGEYIPLANILPFPGPLVETMGNFSSGSSSMPLTAGRIKAGVLICYESIFPELARQEVREGANLLVNITNDAWFGRSSAPVQHFSMAVLRAVENRRSLARCANTGISGFIDPAGRIVSRTPLFTTCSLEAEMALMDKITFFNRYGCHFPLLCLFFVVPLVLFGRRKKRGCLLD